MKKYLLSPFSIAFGLAVLSCFPMKARANETCTVAVSVAPARPVAILGEPIELVVTYKNSGAAEARIVVAYPSLGGHGYPGLTFKPDTDSVADIKAIRQPLDQIEPNVTVPAHSSWSVKVYRQLTQPSPSAGTVKALWSFQAPCVAEDGSQVSLLDTHGSLSFAVKSGSQTQLQKIAEDYSKATNSDDPWQRQEAVEALTVFPNAVVIPELEKLIKAGYTVQGLNALIKFKDISESNNVVMTALESGGRPSARAALNVLLAWNEPLDPSFVDKFVDKASPPVRTELLRYIQKTGNQGYVKTVEKLSSSSDESVSQSAKQVLSQLQSQHK